MSRKYDEISKMGLFKQPKLKIITPERHPHKVTVIDGVATIPMLEPGICYNLISSVISQLIIEDAKDSNPNDITAIMLDSGDTELAIGLTEKLEWYVQDFYIPSTGYREFTIVNNIVR